MRIQDSQVTTGAHRAETDSAVSRVGSNASSSVNSASHSSSDSVSLSGVGRVLQTSASDRAARLANLTQLVRSGNYNVAASATSGSLVSETLAQKATLQGS